RIDSCGCTFSFGDFFLHMRRATLWLFILILFAVPMQATPSHDPKVWYDEFNEEYFWNSLPKNTDVELVTDLGDAMGDTFCAGFHTNCRIRIEERSNPMEVEKKITLLHEM